MPVLILFALAGRSFVKTCLEGLSELDHPHSPMLERIDVSLSRYLHNIKNSYSYCGAQAGVQGVLS